MPANASINCPLPGVINLFLSPRVKFQATSGYARAYFEHKLTILEDSAPGDLKNFLLAGKFANRFYTVIDVPNGDP